MAIGRSQIWVRRRRRSNDGELRSRLGFQVCYNLLPEGIHRGQPALYQALELRLIRDDGAVVYLNGIEIFRDNLQPGRVSWNSLALNTIEGLGEITPVEVRLGTNFLRAGTNVLAVEVHQAAANSSDLGFDLALSGLRAASATGVIVTAPADGERFNAIADVALEAYGNTGVYPAMVEYYGDGVRIGASTVPPFRVVWNNPPIGEHRVVARATYNGGTVLDSPEIGFTVNFAGRGVTGGVRSGE